MKGVNNNRLFTLLIVLVYAGVTYSSLLVIYDTGVGEIRIRDAINKNIVKTFSIQGGVVTGLVVDYGNDTIFYSDDINIYQIYLVDTHGKRWISGKGLLFTENNLEHHEVVLYRYMYTKYQYKRRFVYKQPVTGLYLHNSTQKLYGILRTSIDPGDDLIKVVEIHTDDGSLGNVPFSSMTVLNDLKGFMIHNGRKYFLDSCNRNLVSKCIFVDYYYNKLVRSSATDVSAFAVNTETDQLFFSQDSSIHVLDTRLNETAYGIGYQSTVVIADGRVTKNVQALDVLGRLVVWSSPELKKIFGGVLNKNGSFLSMADVFTLDDEVKGRNVIIFDDKKLE